MYIEIDVANAYRVVTGGPVIMIASKSKAGVNDVMTCAWNCPFDVDETIVVLDRSHTTADNINDTLKYVICIPGNDLIDTLLAVGSAHGRDCGDKFAATNTKAQTDVNLSCAVPEGCLAYIECELTDKDLFNKKGIALGKVTKCLVRKEYWNQEQESFEKAAALMVHHVEGSSFMTNASYIKK